MNRLTGEQRKAVDDRIIEIADQNNGRVTGAMLVRDARSKASPLHAAIPWDEKKGLLFHQLSIARRLIARVKIVEHTETMRIVSFAYVRDPSRGASEPGYISTVRLRDEVDLAREALAAECARLESLIRRLHSLAQTLGLQREVDELLRSAQQLRIASPSIEVHAHH